MVRLFIFVTFFLQSSAIRLEVELNHSSIKELLPPGPERLRAGLSAKLGDLFFILYKIFKIDFLKILLWANFVLQKSASLHIIILRIKKKHPWHFFRSGSMFQPHVTGFLWSDWKTNIADWWRYLGACNLILKGVKCCLKHKRGAEVGKRLSNQQTAIFNN